MIYMLNIKKADKKTKQKASKKINKDGYFSTSYSVNTNDDGQVKTTAGIIYILPNGNILHVVMTAENIEGKIKETKETIDFLTEHQNEIFNDLAITIVEAGQKTSNEKPQKTTPDPPGVIKKKV